MTLITSYSAYEFVVHASITGNGSGPPLEYYCLHSPACSYAPSTRSPCFKSEFANYTEMRSNALLLDFGSCNQVILEDASDSLYGGDSKCTNCSGVLVYHWFAKEAEAACPLGTEMVIKYGYENYDGEYWFRHDARTKLKDDTLPPGCVKEQNAYRCVGSTFTLHFSRFDPGNFCDASDESNPCPFPLSGHPYGSCAPIPSCPTSRNLLESAELN